MSEVWRTLGERDKTFRQAKIIGLHDDVGFNGAWCTDFALYSRILLVEDVDTKEKFLVRRPRSLWVSSPFDKLGNFVMNHEVFVDIGECPVFSTEATSSCNEEGEINASGGLKYRCLTIDTDLLPESCRSGTIVIKFQPINVVDWIEVVYSSDDCGGPSSGPGTTTTTPLPDDNTWDFVNLNGNLVTQTGAKIFGDQALLGDCPSFPGGLTNADWLAASLDGTCDPALPGCACITIKKDLNGTRRYINIKINEGDNQCSLDVGGTAWRLDAKVLPDAAITLLKDFCSLKEHNLITGEPVEHWFVDKNGNKVFPTMNFSAAVAPNVEPTNPSGSDKYKKESIDLWKEKLVNGVNVVSHFTNIFSHGDISDTDKAMIVYKDNLPFANSGDKGNLFVHVLDCFCFTIHDNHKDSVTGNNPLYIHDPTGVHGVPPDFNKMVFSPWKRAGWVDDAGVWNYDSGAYREDYEGNSRWIEHADWGSVSASLVAHPNWGDVPNMGGFWPAVGANYMNRILAGGFVSKGKGESGLQITAGPADILHWSVGDEACIMGYTTTFDGQPLTEAVIDSAYVASIGQDGFTMTFFINQAFNENLNIYISRGTTGGGGGKGCCPCKHIDHPKFWQGNLGPIYPSYRLGDII